MRNMGDLLRSEHQKKQEYLADYLDFLRSEADERKQLLQALRDGSIEFKELHLSTQQAYNDMARLLKMLVDDFYKQRVFVDTPLPISANIAVELNYQERKYLFLKCAQAITIQPNDGSGTIVVPAGEWFNVSFQRGLKLTAPSVPDSQYATVILRATDVPLSEFVTINSSATNPVNVEDIEQAGYIALAAPPTQTNAGSDTMLTFSQQVNRMILQNNTPANVNFAFDTAATLGSLVLVPGAMLIYPKKITSPHLLTAAAQNINGASANNIVVLGAL